MTDNQPTASGVSEREIIAALDAYWVSVGVYKAEDMTDAKRSWPDREREHMRRALEAALSAKPAQPDQCTVPAQGEVSVKSRFFIDHGMIHDRVTGRHVTTNPDEDTWAGMTLTETCGLLNTLSAAPPQPIPTPDEALREIVSDIVDMARDRDREGVFELLRAEAIENGLVAMSRVAALSRARPEEAIRDAALEEAAKVAETTCLADLSESENYCRGSTDTAAQIAEYLRALKSAHSPAPRVDDATMRSLWDSIKWDVFQGFMSDGRNADDDLHYACAVAFSRALTTGDK